MKNIELLINFTKYKLVMFAMAKLMEMETTEQNKVANIKTGNLKAKIGKLLKNGYICDIMPKAKLFASQRTVKKLFGG